LLSRAINSGSFWELGFRPVGHSVNITVFDEVVQKSSGNLMRRRRTTPDEKVEVSLRAGRFQNILVAKSEKEN